MSALALCLFAVAVSLWVARPALAQLPEAIDLGSLGPNGTLLNGIDGNDRSGAIGFKVSGKAPKSKQLVPEP